MVPSGAASWTRTSVARNASKREDTWALAVSASPVVVTNAALEAGGSVGDLIAADLSLTLPDGATLDAVNASTDTGIWQSVGRTVSEIPATIRRLGERIAASEHRWCGDGGVRASSHAHGGFR